MRGKLAFTTLFLVLLHTTLSSAATIHGTIYDFDLDTANNAIIMIDTVPEQTYVAKDGDYSIDVPAGLYTLTASLILDDVVYTITENITVQDEGDYIVDLILLPDFAETQQLLEEDLELTDVSYPEQARSLWPYLLFFLGLVVVGWLMVVLPKEKPAKPDIRTDVLTFIRKQGGRITQKQIRKQFPLSEAKISLVISELEHDGTIKKVKKGRGNIIILR